MNTGMKSNEEATIQQRNSSTSLWDI